MKATLLFEKSPKGGYEGVFIHGGPLHLPFHLYGKPRTKKQWIKEIEKMVIAYSTGAREMMKKPMKESKESKKKEKSEKRKGC